MKATYQIQSWNCFHIWLASSECDKFSAWNFHSCAIDSFLKIFNHGLIRIISIVHFWDCVIENIVLHRHNNNEQSVKKNKQGTKRKQART